MKKILELEVRGKPIRRVKVFWNVETREFCVKVIGDKGDGYFTPSRQDAIDTAYAIKHRLMLEVGA